MIVDVFLPSILFLFGVIVVFLYSRLNKKVEHLVGGKELRPKHAVLLVVAIGIMVSVILAIPEHALLGLFLFAYTAILFLFTYLILPKWYLAIVPSVLFILSFFYFWNIYTFNLFALTFGISIAVYIGGLFTWKTTAAFAALITIMDIIQVLITGQMEGAFETVQTLGLPAFIQLPMFPTIGLTYLGLGDIFLFGLLSIQTTRKYGKKTGLYSIIIMTIIYLLLQIILLNYISLSSGFPATILVVGGWLTALAANYVYTFISKKEAKPQIG